MELHEHDQVCKGELLNQKRKKYWVDKKSNSNSFFLDAKNLSIALVEDNRYWRWSNLKETSNTVVDVAELIQVRLLEVRGKFELTKLSPAGTAYEVACVIMLTESDSGWEVPVHVRLILPDGNKQERKENLMNKPRMEWVEIPVGEFVASPKRTREIEFSIYETRGYYWKSGLVIKGIAIRPMCLQMDWVYRKSNSNCVFLDAKNLSITCVEDNHYWRWLKIEETSNTVVDVAELIGGFFLEVGGKLEITKLSAGISYEVAFVILLTESASGLEVPVHVRLILPDGNKQERIESLMNKPRSEWIEIRVGEFVASPKRTGGIEFSIYEHSWHWKSGLVIKGIAIRPICQMDWVDTKSNSNCLFLDAKNLSITWVEDNRYWRWSKIEETRNVVVDAAELVEVSWLDVRGKFEITKLSPGTAYEVAFVIMLKENAIGWEVPVNVRLVLPDGNKQERKENFNEKPRGEWIEIPVGEFVASPERAGEVEFSIDEHSDRYWKKRLVVKRVVIRPKVLE